MAPIVRRPAILGKAGVAKIVEIPLDTGSRILMMSAAGAIQKDPELLRYPDLLQARFP